MFQGPPETTQPEADGPVLANLQHLGETAYTSPQREGLNHKLKWEITIALGPNE